MTLFSDHRPAGVNFPTNQFQSQAKTCYLVALCSLLFISPQCESSQHFAVIYRCASFSPLSIYFSAISRFSHPETKSGKLSSHAQDQQPINNRMVVYNRWWSKKCRFSRMHERKEGSGKTRAGKQLATPNCNSASYLTFIVCRSISLCISPSECSLQVVVLLGKLL